MTAAKNAKPTAVKTPAMTMGIGWLIAAVIFLFNPCVNIIDVLPDFFGVVFLINGLRKWGDLCPAISDAIQGLEKLRWFMLLKLACMVLVPMVDDTFVLVMTLGFTIVEMIYLYPAIGRISDGFEYFATRFGGRAVYKNYKNVSALTYIFCVSKAILTVLPEFCSLSDYEYDGYVTSGVQIDIAHYKYALLFIGLFLVGLIGLMWLINVIPYIKRIGAETDFMQRVADQYETEIASNHGLMLTRRLKTVFALFTAGMVFTMNVWIDEFNIIPDFVGAAFLFAGCVMLSKVSSTVKFAKISSLVYLICSTISYGLSVVFAANFALKDVFYRFEANDLYNITRVGVILGYASQFAAIFFIIRELRNIIGVCLAPDEGMRDKRLVNIYRNGQKELDRKFIISLVLYIVSFGLNLTLSLFRAEIVSALSEFWWIPLIVTVVWVLYQKVSTDSLYDQVEYKYI